MAGGAKGGKRSLAGEAKSDNGLAWAGVMFAQGALPLAPAHLSSKKTLRFFARGDGKRYRVMIFDVMGIPWSGGPQPGKLAFAVESDRAAVEDNSDVPHAVDPFDTRRLRRLPSCSRPSWERSLPSPRRLDVDLLLLDREPRRRDEALPAAALFGRAMDLRTRSSGKNQERKSGRRR